MSKYEIGSLVHYYRKHSGLSQQELARLAAGQEHQSLNP
jgi:transcriptional regulator with XRE-family HTH domain